MAHNERPLQIEISLSQALTAINNKSHMPIICTFDRSRHFQNGSRTMRGLSVECKLKNCLRSVQDSKERNKLGTRVGLCKREIKTK